MALETFMRKLEKVHTYRDSGGYDIHSDYYIKRGIWKSNRSNAGRKKSMDTVITGSKPILRCRDERIISIFELRGKLPYEDALDGISNTQTMNPDALGHSPEERVENLDTCFRRIL